MSIAIRTLTVALKSGENLVFGMPTTIGTRDGWLYVEDHHQEVLAAIPLIEIRYYRWLKKDDDVRLV